MAKSNNAKKIAIGAAIAGAAGYITGILTAPKSGKETRKDVHDTAIKAKAEAEKKLKQLHSELNDLMEKAKKNAGKFKNVASKELDNSLNKAQKAKDKARDILSALHDGDADDKDLQKAVKEVNSAIDHLKSFLGKTSS